MVCKNRRKRPITHLPSLSSSPFSQKTEKRKLTQKYSGGEREKGINGQTRLRSETDPIGLSLSSVRGSSRAANMKNFGPFSTAKTDHVYIFKEAIPSSPNEQEIVPCHIPYSNTPCTAQYARMRERKRQRRRSSSPSAKVLPPPISPFPQRRKEGGEDSWDGKAPYEKEECCGGKQETRKEAKESLLVRVCCFLLLQTAPKHTKNRGDSGASEGLKNDERGWGPGRKILGL